MIPVQKRWPEPVREVLQTLIDAGFEAYLVGGCVRDWLRQSLVHDYDVATNAYPESVQKLFEHTIPTGIRHGTITVLQAGVAVEVTTYRREYGYSDGRRPDVVEFDASLYEDLSRRDFTMNAMAVDIDGNLIDPFDGKRDLTDKVIRAVGNAKERFAEDGLRMIRAIRFASVMEFQIETETLKAMEAMSYNLQSVAMERIGQEFLRITASAWWSVSPLLATGPWLEVLPEPWPKLKNGFAELANSKEKQARLARAWEELRFVREVENWSLQGSVAALVCFLARLKDEQVRQWLLRMAWDQQRRDFTMKILSNLRHDPLGWSLLQWRKALFDTGREAVYLTAVLLDALDSPTTPGIQIESRRVNQYNQLVKDQPIWQLRQLAVSGLDLVKLGATGPVVGATLRHLLGQVLAGNLENTREALLDAAKTKLLELNEDEARD